MIPESGIQGSFIAGLLSFHLIRVVQSTIVLVLVSSTAIVVVL